MLLSLKSVSNRELQLSGSHSYSSFPEIFVGALFRTETTDKLFFKSDRNHVNNLKTRIKKVYDCHRDNRNKAEGYYVKLNCSQQNKTKQKTTPNIPEDWKLRLLPEDAQYKKTNCHWLSLGLTSYKETKADSMFLLCTLDASRSAEISSKMDHSAWLCLYASASVKWIKRSSEQ